MFRHFISFSKPSYEKLHRIAKLDYLKLKDSESGNQSLDLFEKYLSSNEFMPGPTLIDQIQTLKKFEIKPIDSNQKETLNTKDEHNSLMKVPNLETIINLLRSKKFDQIKSILSTYHYSEYYFPAGFSSLKNLELLKHFPKVSEILNFHIEELEISGWLQIMEFFQYHSKAHKNSDSFTVLYDNIQFRNKKLAAALQKSNLVETCKFVYKAKSVFLEFQVTPEINNFLLSQSKSALNELGDMDLLNVLIAYPTGKDLDHAMYFPRLIEKYDLIPIQDLINLMVKMKDSNYKIPNKLVNRVDRASFNLFLDISNQEVLPLVKKFIHTDILSDEIIKQVCFCLTRFNFEDVNQNSILYEFFQLISESNYYYLFLRNHQIVYNIIQLCSALKTHQHLTIISKLIHHLKDFNVLDILINCLKAEENDFKVKYFNDIIKAQKEFLDFAWEGPIYQYQFTSHKILENNLIKTVAKMLNDMIYQVNPNHDMVYQYYSSILGDDLPPTDLLETIKPGSAHWARLLWHTKDTVNCSKIAESALKLTPLANDPEYLFYLTSIFPLHLDISSLPESDFSLALAYNVFNSTPPPETNSKPQSHPSRPRYPSIIQFTNLPTEAAMKTIIKLIELNDLKHIKTAIEFTSFIPETHPKFSSKLIKDFFQALAEINPSLIRAQSLKVHLMKAAKEFSSEDLKQISRFLIYLPKHIINEFMQNFNIKGKLLTYDDKENLEKSKDFMRRFKEGRLSQNLVHELKVVDFLDYACREFIIQVLDQEGFTDYDNMSLKVILEILANTAPDQEIQEKVVKHINKFNLWDELSFQDLCNFCLVHSKFEIFLPRAVHERFISVVYAKVNKEERYKNPMNGFTCMKPFKYTTQLEPRTIISNNIKKRQISPSNSTYFDIPYHEVENNIKALAYLNTLNLQRTPDITESLRLFHQNRNSDNEFLSQKLSILEDLGQLLRNPEIKENKIDPKTGWVQDFYIESENLSIKVLNKSDYYITSDFNYELKHLNQMMISQIRQRNDLVCIKFEEWSKLTEAEKHKLISSKN